ncbi:MAG: NAD(P)/FAD-dependent oxidoreductase [Woeseiaceae bacterium]|nr:NAD(P)/FAD-dependent oxidoreductase [Woeseiaceae bacterium]
MSRISRRTFLQSAAGAAVATSVSAQSIAAQGNQTYDYVVAGAGHNSLITAAYLVKAGFSVLVLEGRPTIGGGCKSGEICLPGFQDDWCSSVHSLLMSNPVIRNNELGLLDHGLEYIRPDPVMHIPFLDNTSLTMWTDPARTYKEYAKFSKRDADTFLRLVDELQTFRRDEAQGNATPSLWERRHAMSAYDLTMQTFEDDHVRSFHLAVARFTSEPGGDPYTGRTMFTAIAHQIGGRPIPKGGSGMLSTALGRVIEESGGVILTGMPVAELLIEAGKCSGVVCDDGRQFRARKGVVSTIHIKHLVNMAPQKLWGDEFLQNLELFQPEEGLFAYHMATSAPVEYPLADGGSITPFESTILPFPQRVLRSSYDDARGHINLEDMRLQIVSPSVADATRTPKGFHTVKILGDVPYKLAEELGSWDDVRADVASGVLAYLQRFAPTFTKDKILADVFMSPADLERMNPAFWKGSIHAGDYGPSQSGDSRPVPGWANYRMPIAGLYQTGACTQPGGSISGRPGRNAAAVILADAGMTIAEVVAK